jgi:hypothetical protein
VASSRPTSAAAKKARIADYSDFDGMRFIAKIAVEPAKGEYRAKNVLGTIITPGRKEWHPIEQPDRAAFDAQRTPGAKAADSKAATSANVIPKPVWAQ